MNSVVQAQYLHTGKPAVEKHTPCEDHKLSQVSLGWQLMMSSAVSRRSVMLMVLHPSCKDIALLLNDS